MSHCKHKGCTAESLDDSVYCRAHQLVTGKVRQRITRGGDDPSENPNKDGGRNDDRGNANNPQDEGRNPDRGRTRGG